MEWRVAKPPVAGLANNPMDTLSFAAFAKAGEPALCSKQKNEARVMRISGLFFEGCRPEVFR
jgi:hypothetical protein